MKISRRLSQFALVLLACAPMLAHAKLLSPWDNHPVPQTDAAYDCPAPPLFAEKLDIASYYIDKKYSVIDPKKLEAYQKGTDASTHLGQYATLAADAYLDKGSRAAARCVYSLLDAAAKAKAWTGKMPSNNGVYNQNWLLSGTAIAYLKVRSSGQGTPAQDAEIQKWFRDLAGRVRDYFDDSILRPGSDGWNNHFYWAGLAVAAEGIADDDKSGFKWGIDTYHAGVGRILPDGSLEAEMGRAQRAVHYHLYALGPLIILAELGEANGLDLYAEDHGAIHRLANFCVAILEDPTLLEKRTGVAQVADRPWNGQEIGWAVPYVRRFPNAKLSAFIAQAPWVRFWQWGGAPPPAVGPTAR
jgi:poly(beta-D-mannuronate) lyase